MMKVPLDTGFCPDRWKQAVGVMLEKIPGVARSNKMRIIKLLERPKSIPTHGARKKNHKACKRALWNHPRASVWAG
jgi:hypothetical protein